MATTNGVLDKAEQPLRVLIAGAGIGGLSAAIALRQAGHDVEVSKDSPSRRSLADDEDLDIRIESFCDGDRRCDSHSPKCQWGTPSLWHGSWC